MKFLSEATLPQDPRFIQPRPVISFGSYSAALKERRAAYDELWTATDDLQSMRDNANARGRAMQEAYKARNTAILEATGEDPSKMSREERAALLKANPGADIETAMNAAYKRRLADIASRHPDKAGIIRADVPIEQDAFAIARQSQTRATAAQARAEAAGLSGPATVGATLGGSFRAFFRDPVQVGTLALGAGPSTARTIGGKILQTVFTEAVVNAGVETAVQAASHEWKQRAGLDASLGTALTQIGLAAAFGGGIGGLLEGGRAAFTALRRPVSEPVLQAAAAGEEAAIRTIAEAVGRPLSEAEVSTISRAAEADAMDQAAFGSDLDAPEAPRMAERALQSIEDDLPLPPVKRRKPRAPRVALSAAAKQAQRVVNTFETAGARPRQPVHLNRFLVNAGGLRDYGGELRGIDAHRLIVPGSGKLVRENGRSLDNAREAAAEAGYFNDRYGDADTAVAQSTIADLLDAIDRDMRGTKVYSGFDADDVDAAAQAAERQARRAEARAAIEQIVSETDGNLPDAIIARAAELHFDGDDHFDALERAIIEDYNRDSLDVALEREDGSEFEIPFFGAEADGSGFAPQRQADANGGADSRTGAAGQSPEARGPVREAGDPEGQADAITPDTLAPQGTFEPGTPQAADLAALALTEARGAARENVNVKPAVPYGGWMLVNRQTGEAVLETSDPAKVAALNTEKYQAVPVRDYLENLNRRIKDAASPPPSAENTEPGLQVLIPGVGEVTIKEKLDIETAKPMRGGNLAPGGLFDDIKTKQIDLMDYFPAGTNANGSPRLITHADMAADADRDDFFGDLIASCKD